MKPVHAVIALLMAAMLQGSLPPPHLARGADLVGAPEQASEASCVGEYADSISALSPKAQAFEDRRAPYTYCIRATATYECPSYGGDGTLRRTRRTVVAHGTGFGLRQSGGDTLIVTDQHLAEWPVVTDGDHPVDDVPAGCRRVSDDVRIVDSDRDDYERDDVLLARVVSDPQLDVAVLRAKAPLPVMPWKIGHSSALRERNAVEVRGFPLGVLRANMPGKVVSAYEHDDDGGWDHDDFVVDARLSDGNAGAPVFAISCRTREFELVGVYHASYSTDSDLGAVVGVDQLRELFTTLKRAPRPRSEGAGLVRGDREKLLDGLRPEAERFFPLGGTAAVVRARPDGALLVEVMGRDFPLLAHPVLVLEDLPKADGESFGEMGRVWAGNRQGLREVDRAGMDADALSQAAKLLDSMRRDALMSVAYRAALRAGVDSREEFKEVSRMERALRRVTSSQSDLGQAALDMADRLCPATADAPMTIASALAVPPAPGRRGTARGGPATPGAALPAARGEALPVAAGAPASAVR
jgi:hypothetical protein